MPMRNTPRVYLAALRRKLDRLLGQDTDPYLPLPPGVQLSPYPGHRVDIATAIQKLAFKHNRDVAPEVWQRQAREKLADLMGWPFTRPRVETTLAADWVKVGSVVKRRTFYLRVRAETDLAVHLLWRDDLPDPCPVYMHLAGSTSGVHVAWGEAKVPIDHQRIAIGGDMARQAVERGYLAVAIEQLGFGDREERILQPRSSDRLTDAANHAILLGRTLQGEKCWDVSSVIDWLGQTDALPVKIDKDRLFLFGHSSGGSTALFAGALDERIAGVVCSGSIGRFCDTAGGRRSPNGELIIPGLLNWLEMEDLIALCAPRAFVALSGNDDHIFPYSGAHTATESARPIYRQFNADKKLQAVQTNGPHRYYPQETWDVWGKVVDPK